MYFFFLDMRSKFFELLILGKLFLLFLSSFLLIICFSLINRCVFVMAMQFRDIKKDFDYSYFALLIIVIVIIIISEM